jgi:hypothetical protein
VGQIGFFKYIVDCKILAYYFSVNFRTMKCVGFLLTMGCNLIFSTHTKVSAEKNVEEIGGRCNTWWTEKVLPPVIKN